MRTTTIETRSTAKTIENNFKRKRRRSFLVIGIYIFCSGMEFGIVFPTLWAYLQYLGISDSNTSFLGICISALTFSDLLVSPLVGRLLDHFRQVRYLLLVLNLFQITGSLLYLFAQSPNWLLCSRLMSGVGNVATVALTTDVCRGTTKEERNQVLLSFGMIRQIGFMIGPVCNLFLRHLHFSLFDGLVRVHKLNAPGCFTFAIYAAFQVVAAWLYNDLAVDHEAKEAKLRQLQLEGEASPNDAREVGVSIHSTSERSGNVASGTQVATRPNWKSYKAQLLRGEVVAAVFLIFFGFFTVTCFETLVTPYMKIYFDYGDFETSILFLLSGLELICLSVILIRLGKHVTDRCLILAGIVITILAYLLVLVFFGKFKEDDQSNIYAFAITYLLLLAGSNTIISITVSLSTKLVAPNVQGLNVGVRRFFVNCGMLLGPLWSGSTLHSVHLVFGVPCVMLWLGLAMFADSFGRMVPWKDDGEDGASTWPRSQANPEAEEERTPLLGQAHNPAA